MLSRHYRTKPYMDLYLECNVTPLDDFRISTETALAFA